MSETDSNPPGFERYPLYRDEYRRATEIFVPSAIKEHLVEDSLRRFKEAEAARDEVARLAKAPEIELALKRTQAPETPEAATDKTKDQTERDQETQAWAKIDQADREGRSRLTYPVFKSDQALALLQGLGKGDKDDHERLEKIYRELLQRGTTLRTIARAKSLKPLHALAATQPHMKEVVNFIISHIKLAQRSRQPVRLPPMLLLGEPGVGKTHFALALAKALSTTVHIQQMDSDLTSSFLMGSDRKWGNSQHGMLFDRLVLGQYANPIVVLDELDKSQRSLSYGSPLSSLYSVLEPLSAKCVRDISLLFEFDASQVTWIATANDVRLLDGPLRSRFKAFEITPPETAAECLDLAGAVMRAAIESVAIKGFQPDVSLRRHLAHLSARQISQLTLEALAHAVAANRRELHQQDFPRWLFDEDATVNSGVDPTYIH